MDSISFSIFEVIILFGIVQGLVCFFYLMFLDSTNRSSHLLAWCILSVTLILVRMMLHSQHIYHHPYLVYFPFSVELLPAPLFYLYTLSLERKQEEKIKFLLLFIMPGIVFLLHGFVTYISCLFVTDISQKQYLANTIFKFQVVNFVEDILTIIFVMIFSYLAIMKLLRYKKILNDYASKQYANQVKWLLWLIYLFVIAAVITILVIAANSLFDYGAQYFWHDQLHHILFSIFLYFSSFFIIRNMHIIPLRLFKKDLETGVKSKSDLSPYFDKLEKHLIETKAYTNPNLSLPFLANQLNIKSYLLSQSIKQRNGLSFRSYVNNFRVDDVMKKLQNPNFDHLTLLGVAYEAGFNSEASFYRIFKKTTGQSPNSYKSREK